jgi:putative transposase
LWQALRYTELNPVRAGLALEAAAWPWSSASSHCGTADPPDFLDMKRWSQQWKVESWQKFLATGESETDRAALRRCTRTGRPLGSEEFIRSLEQTTHRHLAPQKGGRPRKLVADKRNPRS